jgi:hypothetical protein
MFLPEIDRDRRLIRFTATGDVGPEDAQLCLECLQALHDRIEPGYRVLGDLHGLTAMSPAAAPYIGKIMDVCAACGVELVLRIPPPEPRLDIGFAIMSQFHYGPQVEIVACASAEEAERLLAEE